MRSPRPFLESVGTRLSLLCVLVSTAAAACSSTSSSGDTSLAVEVLQSEVTVENRTGTPLVRGEVSVIPQGTVPRPYVVFLPHMSSGEKRTFALSSFRNSDGTRFLRGVAKGRRVRVTAKDAAGRTYEREVPFK